MSVAGDLRARRRRPGGVLGRAGREARVDARRTTQGARLEAAARQVVRRRQAQRLGQLRRPPHPHARGATRRRSIWEGEPGDRRTLTYWDLYVDVNKFANVLKIARREEGRSRRDLPADDPRSGDRDARLRAHRRHPLGGVRRLLAGVAARPHQRRAVQGAHHRRRRLSPRARSCRSSATPTRRSRRRRRSSTSSSCSAGPAPASDEAFAEMTEGRDHWWHRLMRDARACGASPSRWTPRTCSSSSTPPAPPASRRGSSTPPAATSSARTTSTKHRLRPQGGRRLLVHRRRRLGHRPLVSRLRPARQRRDVRDVRGRARLAGEGSLLGASASGTA